MARCSASCSSAAGDEVLVLVVAAGGTHPRPAQAVAELGGAVAPAAVGSGDRRLGVSSMCGGRGASRSGSSTSRLISSWARSARDLSAGREPGAPGGGEGVPGAGEAGEIGATAVAVGGEHRADAAAARVGVGADDDAIPRDALEHRNPGAAGKGVDRAAQAGGAVANGLGHRRSSGSGREPDVMAGGASRKRILQGVA